MKTILATIAAIGMTAGAAAACPLHTAGHESSMSVASAEAPMSTVEDVVAEENVDDVTTGSVETETEE